METTMTTTETMPMTTTTEVISTEATSPTPTASTTTSDLPAGRAVALDPVTIQPGAIEQLFYRAEGGEILRGLTVSPGASVVKVLVGREQFPTAGQSDWKACIGRQAPAGSYVIALVQNTTPNVIHAAGCWYVEGGSAEPGGLDGSSLGTHQPSPQNPAVQTQGIAAAPPPPAVQYVDSSLSAPVAVVGAITPGPNEVAVLLVRAEAVALLERIRTNMPLAYHEAPSIVRRLNAALGNR